MNKKVGIIVQARMGSTRLPGKIMKDICTRPMLGHILDRLRFAKKADLIIIATTVNPVDDVIEDFAIKEGFSCYRGDEMDVLDRYYMAAQHFKLVHIVRATADNPLVDPVEVDSLVGLHLKTGADYTHAFGQLPVGVGAECFTMDALSRSWKEGHLPNHREHVNEYIQERPDIFHIEELDVPREKSASSLRLTVDTEEDFDRINMIYRAAYIPGSFITTEEAIKLCGLPSA